MQPPEKLVQAAAALIRPFRNTDAPQVNAVALAAFMQYRQHYADWERFGANIAMSSHALIIAPAL
ncbi:hypothetical protein GCM10010970_03340 [Silvimonas iriomotensis]|uniref:Uncharacterized protein n=1 Tax=Silvimonas iriomotensis TaxID=449662 RepID=A0ABQ2P4U2_9NEIS|nr:hypothetical protein GCM10010970_03340 [Silvimonas iriomotensis]